jgi:beta-arabinofuranosyltransferase
LKEPGESKTKTPAKVILPAKPPNIISSDHRDSKELSSGKGALLGLANYNSDDDDDDSGDGNDKPVSNLSSETNAGTANPEKKSSHGSTSLGEDVKVVDKRTQRTNAEPKHEHTHDMPKQRTNGEFPLDAKTLSQPKDCHKMDEKAYRHLEKSSKGTLVKEEKADHTKELESSIGEKYDNDGKCSMYDKKGSIKGNKGSDRIAKHEWDTREQHNRIDSKHDDAKGDRKDIRKDTRERKRDSTDRRGSRGKDEKEDRSRQITKSSTSHSSRTSRSRSLREKSD